MSKENWKAVAFMLFVVNILYSAGMLLMIWEISSTSFPEPCLDEITEERYFNGNVWVETWEIRGEVYLVNGNEILGLYSRFYNPEGKRK